MLYSSLTLSGNATSWYTDTASQNIYLSYVSLLVNRYKSSEAIFAFELMNEPRCHGCPITTIAKWASIVSTYIKSIDPTHLVTLGDEGWMAPSSLYKPGDGSYAYSGAEGVDFIHNMGIRTLDYGVFHLYPDSWGYNYTWGNEWIMQHDAVGAEFGKPVVLEEYGTSFPHNHTGTEGPWQATVLEQTEIAADQFWQFGTQISTGLTNWDVNTLWTNDTEYATLAVAHAAAMLAKVVV